MFEHYFWTMCQRVFPRPILRGCSFFLRFCWGLRLVVYHCYSVMSLLLYWCVLVGLPRHAVVTVSKETFIPRSASGQLATTFSPDSDIIAVETLLTLLWRRQIFSYKHTCTKKNHSHDHYPSETSSRKFCEPKKRTEKTSQDTGKADYYVENLTGQRHDRIRSERSATVDRSHVFQHHFPL